MSRLATEAQALHELAEETIKQGFHYALKAGEVLQEVESMVGTEQFETWLSEHCSAIPQKQALKYIELLTGKTLRVTVSVERTEPDKMNIEEVET